MRGEYTTVKVDLSVKIYSLCRAIFCVTCGNDCCRYIIRDKLKDVAVMTGNISRIQRDPPICQFAPSYTVFIRISTLSTNRPPRVSSLAPSFVHTRVGDTGFGLDGLQALAREGQPSMSALHVACQFVLPGKAILPTKWAADDMAWESFGILAMNGRVVAFHIVSALGADSTAVICAGVDQLLVLVTSLRTEMTFFMEHHVPGRNIGIM